MSDQTRKLVELGVLRAEEAGGLTIYAGDHVRLKFALPNGQVEILDGEWISVECLTEDGGRKEWVVVRAQGKLLWKPLGYLVQVEVLKPNEEARQKLVGQKRKVEAEGYHG